MRKKTGFNNFESFAYFSLTLSIKTQEFVKLVLGKFWPRLLAMLWQVTTATFNDVITSVVALQVCAGHDAGGATLPHAMSSVYNEEKTEAELLVDA